MFEDFTSVEKVILYEALERYNSFAKKMNDSKYSGQHWLEAIETSTHLLELLAKEELSATEHRDS